jgi:magnesium transporter
MEKHYEFEEEKYVEVIRQVVSKKDEEAALKILKDLHPADIALLYNDLSIEEAKYLYLLLDKDKASEVLVELDEDDRRKLLTNIPISIIVDKFINNMQSDDAVDIIKEFPENKQKEIISEIQDFDLASDVVDLLNYDTDTAGGLMAKELISLNENLDVDKAINVLRSQIDEVGKIYYIYLVDDNNLFIGTVSLKKLLVAPRNTKVKDLVDSENHISVDVYEPAEAVAEKINKYNLVALPVIDSIGRLLGRITIDDVVDFITEEAEKDYQLISGITEDVEIDDGVLLQTKARIPWLFIGLFGGIIGSLVMGYFEHDMKQYMGIAMFIPMIAAMGGNVGVQSSSIIVQSIANNSINNNSIFSKLMSELMVALVNGGILSTTIFLYNLFFSTSFQLTVAVGLSLFSVIIFASLFGTFVPLVLQKLKIDPAVATGPFITTTNDIAGLFIYFMITRAVFMYF